MSACQYQLKHLHNGPYSTRITKYAAGKNKKNPQFFAFLLIIFMPFCAIQTNVSALQLLKSGRLHMITQTDVSVTIFPLFGTFYIFG